MIPIAGATSKISFDPILRRWVIFLYCVVLFYKRYDEQWGRGHTYVWRKYEAPAARHINWKKQKRQEAKNAVSEK